MLRVMLVDDEPPARRGLRRLLQAHADIEIVAEAGSVAEARAQASAQRPDAIFLDVELTDGRGFDLIDQLPRPPAIVFVTAHDLYAVRAFDVSALDFLLKPVDPQRLAATIDRLRRHGQDAARAAVAAEREERQDDVELDDGTHQRIHLRIDGRSVIAPLGTVAMLAAEADFTRVFLKGARDYLVCRLLRYFEEQLPKPPFVRISRSLIVNLDQLERVEWLDAGRCSLSLGEGIGPVSLGRIAARRLRQSIETNRMVSA
ncbi:MULTISPECIES: LytR/AlgR family response regulator transcription factor [Inquilinus]|uniref:Two-component system LytT family response regulator n=1 Tax=Inquilinus ginsengisoli TaxID=363840 RepID=A0ABU1JXB7_9PROT|nr:LytTR family DNA-binding domain-containing protein [Inquilinus ginsengisoli]MDR6292943.1 two-component system LytT family response regulator [Inquilinus ginsengisoli]